MEETTPRFGGIAERLVLYPLLAIVGLAPIFFIPSTGYPFEATKLALVAFGVLLALCLYVVTRIERQELTLPKQGALFAVWLLPVVYGISTLWNGGGNPPLSFRGLETDTFYFALLCAVALTVTALVATGAKRLRMLGMAAIVAFCIITLFQVLRLMGGPDAFTFGGLFAGTAANLLGKWNEVGIFYGLAATISLIALTMRLSAVMKAIAAISLAVSLFFMMVVNISVAWAPLALVSLVVFVAGLWGRMVKKPSSSAFDTDEAPRAPIGTAMVAAIVLLISAYFAIPAAWMYSDSTLADNPEPRSFLADRIGIAYLEARPSWDGTMAIMKNVYHDSAVFGSGPGTFVEEWLRIKPLDVNRTIFWNVDFQAGVGYVPTSWVTTGLAGLAAWLLFFAAFLYAGFRALVVRSGGTPGAASLISFVAAVYLFTASIFYVTGPVLLILAFIAAGAFFASLLSSGSTGAMVIRFEENPRFGFVATLIAIVIFLVGAASMFVIGTKYVSAVYFQNALIAFNVDGDLDRTLEKAALAGTFNNTDRVARLQASAELAKVIEIINDTDVSADEARTAFEEHFGNALRYAEKATDLGPTNYQNWVTLGRVAEIVVPLGNDEGYDRAKNAYEMAIELNPQSPSIYLMRGNLELAKNGHSAAKPFIEKSLEKKADSTEAIFTLAQIQINENNVPDAIRSVEQAAQLAPNNPVLFFQLGLLYYSQSRFEDAGASFARATALHADYANAHYFLGLTYEALNHRPEALAEFKEVERTNPDNEEVKAIIANLESDQAPFTVSPSAIKDLDGLPIEE